MFALDKRADQRCPHLADQGRCGIHPRLAREGFAGCVAYDCHGAGQRVTAALPPDGGDPASVYRVFRALCHVHAMASLVRAARALDLPPSVEAERLRVAGLLEGGPGATFASLASFDVEAALGVARTFLGRLRPHVERRRLPVV